MEAFIISPIVTLARTVSWRVYAKRVNKIVSVRFRLRKVHTSDSILFFFISLDDFGA
jgi:hypothetical protein